MNSEADPPDPPRPDDMSAAPTVKASLPPSGDERTNIDDCLPDLFSSEYERLVSYLARFGVRRAEAKEIAAEAFAKVVQSKERTSISALRAYIYAVVRNLAFNRNTHIAMQRGKDTLLKAEQAENTPSPVEGLKRQQRYELL